MKNHMNALHVVPSMSPEYGGPVAVVGALTSALAHEGIRCEIFSTFRRRPDTDVKVSGEPGVHLFETGPFSRFWPAYSSDLQNAVRAGMKNAKFDIVHVHEPWHHPGFVACHAAIEQGIPLILTPHGTLEEWALKHKSLRKTIYRKLIQDRILSSCDAIHALTETERCRIEELGCTARVFVAPNGVDQNLLEGSPDTSEFMERYPELVGRVIVLFLGRLHSKKGLDVLASSYARIARRHRECALLVAGPDEDGSGKRMESLLKAEDAMGGTVFTGMLTGRDKQAALRCADIFVLTSYSEGFSIAVLEALAAGLPVVISRQCNFPEVAEEGAGFVVEAEEQEVTQAIGSLVMDRALRVSMGRNGRRLVTKKYTWDAIGVSMGELYRTLVARRRSGGPCSGVERGQ